jgi:hypothetical protein
MTVTFIKRLAAVSLLAIGLAACATITAVPAGPLSVKNEYSVTLGRMWSDVSVVLPGRQPKVRVLSLDGPFLNRLYVSQGLSAGEGLLKTVHKEQPMPAVRAGMSASERMEFVADSMSAMGYQKVETAHPQPAKFGADNAVRFDLTAVTPAGLEMKGTALIAEAGGKIYVILYIAPGEHYFEASLPEVEQVMASVRRG